MTTRFQLLNIDDIAVGPLQDSSFIPSQRIAWISSNTANSRLLIQSPEFIAETYGIPREGPFYTTDKPRAFYKMPLCHERHKHSDEIDYQQIEEFFMKLKKLDHHFGSEEFKNKLLFNISSNDVIIAVVYSSPLSPYWYVNVMPLVITSCINILYWYFFK